jgi:hypothetical protein
VTTDLVTKPNDCCERPMKAVVVAAAANDDLISFIMHNKLQVMKDCSSGTVPY